MAQHTIWNNQTPFSVGDTVRVHQKLLEGAEKKERIQIFEGMVIAIHGKEENKSFTVRKIGPNYVGVERIWPVSSPWISKLEVKTQGKVRRAKLYYTRTQSKRQLRDINKTEA